MSHKTRSRRRWGLLPLALTLAFMVVAVPATAKGPVPRNAYGCPQATGKANAAPPNIRALCERRQAASDRQGLSGADAGILAGSVAAVVLVMAGGMLVATHRRDAHGRPAALS